MKKLPKLVGLILAIWFCLASACPAENKGCTIDKKAWVSRINSYIPAEFCKTDSVFMQCYNVSQKRCIDLTLKLTNQCIAKNEKNIPTVFEKGDSSKWGGEIGSCVGDKFTDILKLKRGKSESCLFEQEALTHHSSGTADGAPEFKR